MGMVSICHPDCSPLDRRSAQSSSRFHVEILGSHRRPSAVSGPYGVGRKSLATEPTGQALGLRCSYWLEDPHVGLGRRTEQRRIHGGLR